MSDAWGVIGSGYMAQEYCKVLMAKGIVPHVYNWNLTSDNVGRFREVLPQLEVNALDQVSGEVGNWLVCTNVESHEDVCGRLQGNIYCEKPYLHDTRYDASKDIVMLMNRRYYYWVEFMRQIIADDKIVKIVACIPERGVDALITQSIHVIDLLWYLAGPFQPAARIGEVCPSFMFAAGDNIPMIVNMNYAAHENFSLRFYTAGGVVYEAKPLEAFCISEGMEVRQPDDELPVRSYRPIMRPVPYTATPFKPGLGELVDDLIEGSATRLPSLSEHRDVHAWMEENML